jgi:hypothetical protein
MKSSLTFEFMASFDRIFLITSPVLFMSQFHKSTILQNFLLISNLILITDQIRPRQKT